MTNKTWGTPTAPDGSVSPPPSAMLSSVAKVVQPTATVSSVPVCGPSKPQGQLRIQTSNSALATGIARSVSPGQSVRANVYPAPYGGIQQSVSSPREPTWTPEQTNQVCMGIDCCFLFNPFYLACLRKVRNSYPTALNSRCSSRSASSSRH